MIVNRMKKEELLIQDIENITNEISRLSIVRGHLRIQLKELQRDKK